MTRPDEEGRNIFGSFEQVFGPILDNLDYSGIMSNDPDARGLETAVSFLYWDRVTGDEIQSLRNAYAAHNTKISVIRFGLYALRHDLGRKMRNSALELAIRRSAVPIRYYVHSEESMTHPSGIVYPTYFGTDPLTPKSVKDQSMTQIVTEANEILKYWEQPTIPDFPSSEK